MGNGNHLLVATRKALERAIAWPYLVVKIQKPRALCARLEDLKVYLAITFFEVSIAKV